MAIVDKIEKNAAGQIVFRDADDNIIQTEPPTLGIRMFRAGQPDEGVILFRGASPIIALDASKIKRSQVDPDPEVTGLTLDQQSLAELLVTFFLVDSATGGNPGQITNGLERSGVVPVVLNSTPVHDLVIPNIENASIIEFDVQSNCNLTGIAGLTDWGRYTFHNVGTAILTMPANNVNSAPENRFENATTLIANATKEYFYSGTTNKIHPVQ